MDMNFYLTATVAIASNRLATPSQQNDWDASLSPTVSNSENNPFGGDTVQAGTTESLARVETSLFLGFNRVLAQLGRSVGLGAIAPPQSTVLMLP